MTAVADPALGFWLRHVAASGGLWEPDEDAAYVVLPPQLRDAYRLPEELRVTADPDVAREDGATLLAAGHPVLAEAAERVLASGDAGYLLLARPGSLPPGRDVLLAEARDAFPVDHGRIDLSGEPVVMLHPVVRIGALVTYELSAEDRFGEEAHRWVDVPSRRELPADLVGRLCRAEVDEKARPGRPEGLPNAVAAAHRLIDAAASDRRQALAAEVSGSFEAERGRAAAYYADAITGIERRLATAPPERRAALEQRLHSTREEQARRLAEIAEKYEARHVIRPYRLHVVLVPALRVPADVLRGTRRYPMFFDWLLPAGAYAPVRCPSCGSEAPLVAGKLKLGCEACLPPKPAVAPASPRSADGHRPPAAVKSPAAAGPAVAPGPAGSAAPAPGAPRGARSAPAAKPVPPQAKRRAVVPPKARKEQQKATVILAERLWRAVAAGDRRAIERIVYPGSPAAALDRLLGPAGLCRVLGMPSGEEPERFVAETHDGVVAGALLGARGTECPYYICCRDGQAAEVLPFPLGHDGAFWGFYWWGRRPGARWAVGRIASAKGLDPVEGLLAVTGSAWNGLPVAARAMAAWGRIAVHHERLLSAHDARPLAAAVNRLVAYRAGGRTTFAEAAGQFRVPDQDVRRADRAVRVPLALGPGQPW